jgi:hypothetical protein
VVKARARFMELEERGNMYGGVLVVIVKRMEIVDEEVKVGLWLVEEGLSCKLEG